LDNGTRLREDYTIGRTEPGRAGDVSRRVCGPDEGFAVPVPPDCYFVMGDNRAIRWTAVLEGCIPRANIIGTPLMIYMSIDTPSEPWGSWRNRRPYLRLRKTPCCIPVKFAGAGCFGYSNT